SHGDLTAWQDQGVLLLNRVLTVSPGAPASHRRRGWEEITEHALRALVARGGPLVAILWGRDAQSLIPLLGEVPHVASPHPSPLSASRGFFGSRPFSRTDALLAQQGAAPIAWRIPDCAGPPGVCTSRPMCHSRGSANASGRRPGHAARARTPRPRGRRRHDEGRQRWQSPVPRSRRPVTRTPARSVCSSSPRSILSCTG